MLQGKNTLMSKIPCIHDRWTAPLHLDCIRFCPSDGSLLAVSGYQYHEQSGIREGGIYFLTINQDSQLEFSKQISDIPGVFDFKWKGDCVYAACADGSVRTYDGSTLELRNAQQMDGMVLAVDVKDHTTAACTNMGRVSVNNISWQAHDSEVWWVKLAGANLYTAADAAELGCWDLETKQIIWKDAKTHKAGVCCVETFESNDDLIATSSYDKHVRFFDTRMRRACWSRQLNSGVWRVKLAFNDRLLMCSAMHDGVRLFDIRSDHDGFIALDEQSWLPTDSIAYGTDAANSFFGTVTFYDNQLILWSNI